MCKTCSIADLTSVRLVDIVLSCGACGERRINQQLNPRVYKGQARGNNEAGTAADPNNNRRNCL